MQDNHHGNSFLNDKSHHAVTVMRLENQLVDDSKVTRPEKRVKTKKGELEK